MPIYEYKCKQCNSTFEKLQSIKDDMLTNCIHCDGEVSRVFHPVGIVFKGSGFYTTDYKNKESKKSEKPAPKPKKEDKPPVCAKKDSCPSAANC